MEFIRKIFAASAVLFMSGMVSFADEERAISFEQLPEKSRAYIKEYFPESTVSYAREEKDVLDVDYEVVLSEGVKIEFDKNGEWKEVETRYSELNEKVIPAKLRAYVEKNHPGSKYRKVSRERYGYELKLTSGLELEFDKEFKFLRYDD